MWRTPGWRKWLASKYDPTQYGDSTAPSLAIGGLHLYALQGRGQALGQVQLPTPSIPQSPPLNGSSSHGAVAGYPTERKLLVDHTGLSMPFSGEIVVETPPSFSGDANGHQ